jgi:hypothetical protein
MRVGFFRIINQEGEHLKVFFDKNIQNQINILQVFDKDSRKIQYQ